MNFFILFIILSCRIFLLAKASDATNSCTSAKCSPLSPEIQFPFQIKNLQLNQCGLPQFNLFCKENRTIINFPTYGDLVVKSISYNTRKLSLLDPENCVHEVFLNLNLSLTPFSYYYVVKEYKYINCSAKLVGSFEQVPCLSGSNHHVYVVESSFLVPFWCSSVRSVEIPFSYSSYLSDDSFGLGLTWDLIGVDEEGGRQGKYFKVLYAVTGIIAFVFIVGMLFYALLSQYRDRFNEGNVKETFDELEFDKLLGEYEVLSHAKDADPGKKSLRL